LNATSPGVPSGTSWPSSTSRTRHSELWVLAKLVGAMPIGICPALAGAMPVSVEPKMLRNGAFSNVVIPASS
jgi:hypothetical protein